MIIKCLLLDGARSKWVYLEKSPVSVASGRGRVETLLHTSSGHISVSSAIIIKHFSDMVSRIDKVLL